MKWSFHRSSRILSRFGNSLFCSKSFILKSNCERFALVTLWKRVTVSELLLLLFSESLVIQANRSKKTSDWLKNNIFSFVLTVFQFPPFLCPRVNFSHLTLLSHSFLKSDRIHSRRSFKKATMSKSLPSFFTKERPWVIRSHRSSWQKSGRGDSHFCSFTHKKLAIRSKNRWANSQP